MSSHLVILDRRLPLPKARLKMAKTKKHPEKRFSEVLCTLNNVDKWIRWNKVKIKNDYKDHLKEYFIPEPNEMYDAMVINYRIVRHNKSKLDKDNIIFGLKWLADVLEELGYIKDDRVVNFSSYDTIVDENLPETMFQIQLLTGKKEWPDGKR